MIQKITLLLSCALLCGLLSSKLSAQFITLNGGSADITFFYESQNGPDGTWHVTVRSKGSTVADGLTNDFGGFTGAVGTSSGNDWNFDTLRVNLTTSTTATIGGIDYFVSSASGSSIFPSGTTDLGIRTRLRENQIEIGNGSNTAADQFDDFNIELLSVDGPTGGEFVLFGWDGSSIPAEIRYNTADSILSSDWPAYDHLHRHFGFSEQGVYTLNFRGTGVDGTYGAIADPVDFSIEFNVIPEPGTYVLLFGFGALALVLLRRRKG